MKNVIAVLALAGVVAIATFTLGFFLAYQIQQATLDSLQLQIEERDSEIMNLRNQLLEANNKIKQLTAENEKLNDLINRLEEAERRIREELSSKEKELQELVEKFGERDQMVRELEVKIENLRNALEKLENDKILLNWLRNDIPQEREEAERFWNDTKALAAKSDPSLAVTVDEIRSNMGVFYDWLESFPEDVTFETTPLGDVCNWVLSRPDAPHNIRAFCDWLFNQPPGVERYSESINRFIDEVYLVIISHIDSLLNTIEES